MISATQVFWLAVTFGTLFGLGLIMIYRACTAMIAPKLLDRVRPHVQARAVHTSTGLDAEAAGLNTSAWGTLGRLLKPILSRGLQLLSSLNLSSTRLQTRLAQAGSTLSVTEYRAQQLLWALGGGAIGLLISILLAWRYSLTPLLGIIAVIGLGVLGFALRDNFLSSAIQKRQRTILAEFPTIAELFAMSVSAGESVQAAIARIANTTHSELGNEFRIVQRDLNSGANLATALNNCARRVDLAPFDRFISGLLVAVQRGTPLAAVLRAQAHDIRELSKRELMELAGKKEIGMMAPLIFGILPLTVLFAVYPGISLLNVGI